VAAVAQVATPPGGRVPVYRDGREVERVDTSRAESAGLLLIDLGERWVPPLFEGTAPAPHGYAERFRALARGDYPPDAEGDRARRERHLELYGIPPTLSVLRERLRGALDARCVEQVDLTPLTELDLEPDPDARRAAIEAAQLRLRCDGILRGRHTTGVLDRTTRNALAEFERRHRIYGDGRLTGRTLSALRTDPIELERRAVARVLAERAILAAGVLEDGSVSRTVDGRDRTFIAPDGSAEPLRDLEFEIRQRVVQAFGLRSARATLRFLESLGPLAPSHVVAIDAVRLPAYYGPDMELAIEIDRGDVYYDFPRDRRGRPIEQPIERAPTLTVVTRWRGQVIPLARFATTIGGWHIVRIGGRDHWAYHESPVGRQLWTEIVSAPVWLPPRNTPDSQLVVRRRGRDRINENLIGPGYASAYGLVAAYHQRALERDGAVVPGADEGIRTHGSVNYRSIGVDPSHGCHRLRNHLALRLFTFVLRHRAHQRTGHHPIRYRVSVRTDEVREVLTVEEGGYVFELDRPIPVDVFPGRIRGHSTRPPEHPIPVRQGFAAAAAHVYRVRSAARGGVAVGRR
jgi:hypothetical protein